MTGNRVEELEATVRELQASIDGLTDELVETKERLRYLEDQVGTDVDGIVEGRPSRSEARRSFAAEPDQGDRGGAGEVPQQGQQPTGQPVQEQAAPGSRPASQEDVDRAVESTAESADEAVDGGKSDEVEGGDEEAEQSDDIIVA